MLIALMTILFLGGGAGSAVIDYLADSKGAVKEAVVDDERQKAALQTVKELKAAAKGRSKIVQKTVKELKPYVGDNAGDDDIEALWDSFSEQILVADQEMLDLRFKLRDQLSREEWEKVFND